MTNALRVQMKGYLLYIFDLDGTLVDSANGLINCYRRALDKLDLEYDADDIINFTMEPLYATYSRFKGPKAEFETFENAMFKEYRTSLNSNSIPYSDTRYTLQRIADDGLPMCIATRSTCKRANEVLRIHDLIQYFDHVIGHENVTKQKPDPECLEICTSFYNIEKKDILFVGDGETDMMAAKAFGIDGAFIDRDGTNDCDCTYKIKSLRELF